MEIMWEDYRVYMKEKRKGLYNSTAYWFTNTLPLLILPVIASILFTVVIRPMVGLQSSLVHYLMIVFIVCWTIERLVFNLECMIVFTIAAFFLHQLLISFVPSIRTYYLILPALLLFQMAFTGYFLPLICQLLKEMFSNFILIIFHVFLF